MSRSPALRRSAASRMSPYEKFSPYLRFSCSTKRPSSRRCCLSNPASRGIVYTFVLINISFGLALLLLVTLVLITLRRWRRGARLKGFLAIPVCTLIRLGSRIVNGTADRVDSICGSTYLNDDRERISNWIQPRSSAERDRAGRYRRPDHVPLRHSQRLFCQ